MDLQHALKNLIENGTNIEYFDNGYVIQINKDIKVFEEGKKTLKKLTQTQQNKLLLQARGGGMEPKKKVQKQPQKQLDEDEDFISYEPQEEQNDSDNDSISEVREKPLKKQVRKRIVKTSKTPQINYTNPQLDLEELIRLRTENSFIKQQHQDAVKQIEKYKQKVKRYKQPKEKETKAPKEQEEQIQAPQECQEEPVQYEEQYRDINFDLY
ncbi:MAG: hypothetical protein EZS28_031875 [Streblomastix strix]|uniref:Uncharacterized protein n=1 Tax=Streblomastix strix TaxID=222440 RepID=A0A5J4UQC4_9EUKA|nr:MAG: hypothetical protein EZS28_031875 [Streblomastix strix]